MIGDEAYAGNRNYIHLAKSAKEVLGLSQIVPTHNGIGAEKLLTTTLLKKGQTVLHNRGRCEGLVPANGGISKDISCKEASSYPEPNNFGGNIDTEQLENLCKALGKEQISYVHLETCPEAWNGQPISFANLEAVKSICRLHSVPLVIDISHVLENAYWIKRVEKNDQEVMEIAKEIISLADIVLMDASQDCRSDIGGLIASENPKFCEKFRNQVVVFEGLHTYGGMTGRAMEVFAIGIKEMEETRYVEWYTTQLGLLFDMLKNNGVPVYRGGNEIAVDVGRFLPDLSAEKYPKFVLAASLYIWGA
jgi:tyrosine phenol-lyase